MENMIQGFFGIQFFFLSLALAGITYVARLFIEFILELPQVPSSKYSKFWTRVFLPALPVIMGAFIVKVTTFPFPETFSGDGGRMAFGIVAGLFSGFAYRIVKGFLSNSIANGTSNVTLPTLPPPSMPAELNNPDSNTTVEVKE